MFEAVELRRFIQQATWLALNDYEARMLCERTGESLEALSRSRLEGIIVTLGADGCELWENGRRRHIPGVEAAEVVVLDHTRCLPGGTAVRT